MEQMTPLSFYSANSDLGMKHGLERMSMPKDKIENPAWQSDDNTDASTLADLTELPSEAIPERLLMLARALQVALERKEAVGSAVYAFGKAN